MRRTVALVAALAALVLTGCSGSDEPSSAPSPSGSPTSPSTSPASPTSAPATVPPAPLERACYALSYDEAVAPTTSEDRVSCKQPHTAVTYAVGAVDALVDGHLLAVDSDRVQAQVASTCPGRFADFVGGTVDDRRLSMLRPVWFTPTVEESDAGATWYRCDAVALATDGKLAPLAGPVEGVLDTEEGQDRYGMCGTAQPGTQDFQRVVCSQEHSWRAIAVVPFPAGDYPGEAKVKEAGQSPCQDAGAAAAADSLDYEWGYEWPTAEQWRDGQTFGRCWAPD
ncbi:septum formation family protein [Nocardioides sp.]|uniref:septum formation family protein n=1 Tax=Nocardioides sp. TaxID=35761 RepID=UPI003783C0B5